MIEHGSVTLLTTAVVFAVGFSSDFPQMDEYEGMAFVSGEICRLTGVYRARCHPKVRIELDEGEIFPPCAADCRQHTALWEYVESPWNGWST